MDQFFSDKDEESRLSKVILPFLLLGFVQGVRHAQLQGAGVSEDDVFTAAVKQHIQAKAFEHASLVTDTTKEKMKGLLQEAIDEGQGTDVLARNIRDLYDGMIPWRSQLIARTEITGTVNDGAFQTLRAEGHEYKAWSTVEDGHERDSHHIADGQVVPIDEPFHLEGGDLMFPGDDSLGADVSELANCRCTPVASDQSEERVAQLKVMYLRAHSSLEMKMMVSLQSEFDAQKHRVLSHFPSIT